MVKMPLMLRVMMWWWSTLPKLMRTSQVWGTWRCGNNNKLFYDVNQLNISSTHKNTMGLQSLVLTLDRYQFRPWKGPKGKKPKVKRKSQPNLMKMPKERLMCSQLKCFHFLSLTQFDIIGFKNIYGGHGPGSGRKPVRLSGHTSSS